MPDLAPPRTRARSPIARGTRLTAVGAALVVALLLAQLPLPVYVLQPGPVFPLAGAVTMAGGDPITGDFMFTTIQLVDADVIDVLLAAVDRDAAVVSRASILGGLSEAAFVAAQEAAFADAELSAVRLGLAAAGSGRRPDAVRVDSSGVGGPSAGLLIALAVADLAMADDLAGGRLVAGTGAVDADGRVGPVGSVIDKVRAAEAAGADVFLVAAGQAEQARSVARTAEVVGVTSVDDAVAALLGR